MKFNNDVVQAISAWAAIIAVPTFFASIWGMNFEHMPELGLRFGYPLALVLMFTATLVLYRFFNRIFVFFGDRAHSKR